MTKLVSLSQDEQKKIRARIERALCLGEDSVTSIIPAPSDSKIQESFLKKESGGSASAVKMNRWVRGLFTTKKESDFLLEDKLKELRKKIQETRIPYADFTMRTLGPGLATAVYEVYRKTDPFRALMRKLFEDAELMEKLMRKVVETRLHGAKISLMDFISFEEMKELFFQTESMGDLVEEINKRLGRYFAGLKDEDFDKIREGVLGLYNLKNLTLFPYDEFFRLFHFDASGNESDEDPAFESAELFPTLELVERFCCALFPFRRGSVELFPEVVEFCVRSKGGSRALEELGVGDKESQTVYFRKDIVNLVETAGRLYRTVPFTEIVRYFMNDPYYKVMMYLPKPRMKDFYIDSVRLKVFTDFEDFFSKVRFDILEDMILLLFRKDAIANFEFYLSSGIGISTKSGYPGFIHQRSLVILNNFIRVHYRGFIQSLVHLLNRAVTNRLRDNFSLVLIHASGIEDIGNKLREFDHSFSPDADDGRALIKMKFVIDRDQQQMKMYRALVAQKDREAKDLLEKGISHLDGLLGALAGMAKDQVFLSESAKKFRGIDTRLKQAVDALSSAVKVIRHLAAVERGAL